MKKTINKYEFIESMQSYYDGNGFSYEGLSCLFDYLEEYEQETGEDLEFDAVALHCQFSEMTVEDFINYYYDDEDIEAIITDNGLESKEEITAEMINAYEYNNMYDRIIVVNENTIIVDIER